MPRLVLCVLSIAITQLCFSISAAADDLAICLNKNISEQHIVACSNVIDSQQFSGRNLALSYNNRGVAWWKRGASDQALADYDAAIRIMPSLFTAYANRCVVFTYRSEPDRAIQDCNRAIALNPNYALAYNSRALAWRAKGELDQAIVDLNAAIRLDPGSFLAFANRCALLTIKGNLKQAVDDCNKALQLNSKYALGFSYRGVVWENAGDLARALSDYNTAIQLDPTNIIALKNRGSLYERSGNFDLARADYETALNATARNPGEREAQNIVRQRLAALKNAPMPQDGHLPVGLSSGTGIFVSADGKLLTNNHVVAGCGEIRIRPAESTRIVKLVARDTSNDLALLATDQKPNGVASWRTSVRLGEEIIVYGFPLSGVLASGGNITTGNVTALVGVRDDSRRLQISAPVQPGNSGGPLLDHNGNVVGIVVGQLPSPYQNVNFAIKSSVARDFLDAQGVQVENVENHSVLSTPDIADRAKTFTVRIECEKQQLQ